MQGQPIEKDLTEVSRCCSPLTYSPQAITTVYDGLADLPLDEVTYETVLKPLIDLDFESQSKNSWLDVS